MPFYIRCLVLLLIFLTETLRFAEAHPVVAGNPLPVRRAQWLPDQGVGFSDATVLKGSAFFKGSFAAGGGNAIHQVGVLPGSNMAYIPLTPLRGVPDTRGNWSHTNGSWDPAVKLFGAGNPNPGSLPNHPGNASLPTVTTSPVSNITQNTATCGGNVISEGGSSVTAYGVCWSTSQNPTTADNHTTDGSGKGVFVSNLINLSISTIYYIRAYATNGTGTSYGNQVGLITLPWVCGDPITLNHVTTNGVAPVNKTATYGTVTNIPGEPTKCWITSNLGADSTATEKGDNTEASAGWYWQFNLKQGYKHDGTTRTPASSWISLIDDASVWQAANDPCAIEFGGGWRIPDFTEWYQVDESGGWDTWNKSWESGLNLHAAGVLARSDGSLLNRGFYGNYWSSEMETDTSGWSLYSDNDSCVLSSRDKAYGMPLRCILGSSSSFTAPLPQSFCVQDIDTALYYDPTMDIMPVRPDYFIFKKGITTVLDITIVAGIYCIPPFPNITINWRIDFTPTPDPLDSLNMVNTPPIVGTGQPSIYDFDIELPGDGLNFTDVVHHITYWIIDCNGYTSIPQTVPITIKPRPNVIKQ